MEETKEQDAPESEIQAEAEDKTPRDEAAPADPGEDQPSPAMSPGGSAPETAEGGGAEAAPPPEETAAEEAVPREAPPPGTAETAAEPSAEEESAAPVPEAAAPDEAEPPEEAAEEPGETPAPRPLAADGNKRWYIVHTYSGYEQKVKLSLERQLQTYSKSKNERDKRIAGYFGDILIPTENVVELVKGQRKTTTRKFFPGYILVQMEDNEESRHFVRETPKVSGFVGGGREPTPISEEELNRIVRQQTEGAERPKPKVQFEHGENIRVIHGPFANFTGVVEDVKPEKGKVRVLVTIFGRATPVELSFVEVEKT